MTELIRPRWSVTGVLAGLAINVPDLAFALTALAWGDATSRASALSASLAHAIIAVVVLCLIFEPSARHGAAWWACTEVLKALGFNLQYTGSVELGTAVLLTAVLIQSRTVASLAMFNRAPWEEPEPGRLASLGRFPHAERSGRPTSRAT